MKTTPTARELVEFAARMGAAMFEKDGVLQPLWHVVRANGEHGVIAPDEFGTGVDKDIASEAMRRLIERLDVVVYVFMAESWMRLADKEDGIDLEAVRRKGLGEDPKRVECLWYSAEDAVGTISAYQLIERPKGQKPRLAPIRWLTQRSRIEGRFVGLLPVKGRVH